MGEKRVPGMLPQPRSIVVRDYGRLLAVSLLPVLSACSVHSMSDNPKVHFAIADFESAQLSGDVWQSYPLHVEDRLTATRVCPSSDNNHALRIDYAFNSSAKSAIGYRLPLRDFDASRFDHLSMKVLAESKGQSVASFVVELKRPEGHVPGMDEKGSYAVTVPTGQWQQIRIPLNYMIGLRDRQHLRDLVVLFQSRRDGQQGRLTVDDIGFEWRGHPGPSISDPVSTPKKTALETQAGNKEALQPALRERLRAWPFISPDRAKILALNDDAFLRQLAADTWGGLDALVDREHGLPIDNLTIAPEAGTYRAAYVGDYTNVTNIGLHLMAIIGARDLGYVDVDTAVRRIDQTLTTLEKLETVNGFYYNYYDTTTLERTTNFVSFVDSAWLTAGLMVLRNAMPQFAGRCTHLIDRGNYGFFFDDAELLMRHGYFAHMHAPSEYHYGALYAESRLGSVIAIGKHDVPLSHWYALLRTFPNEYTWQTQQPFHSHIKRVDGHSFPSGLYKWDGLSFVPSWGGSMFEALMPVLVLDEPRFAPRSLGRNDAIHVAVQRRFASEVMHYPVWGMSPSADPVTNGYGEYGVPWLGTRGYSAKAVTPHAAALALMIEPSAATADLRRLTERYNLYGPFGLYDAVDPVAGAAAHKYLALNQSMLFLALVNHLGNHAIQRYFAADPIVRSVIPMLAVENFWDD